MKKFLLILMMCVSIFTYATVIPDTVFVNIPARVKVVKDSIYSVNVISEDSSNIKQEFRGKDLYVTSKYLNDNKTLIIISTPKNLDIKTSKDFKIMSIR